MRHTSNDSIEQELKDLHARLEQLELAVRTGQGSTQRGQGAREAAVHLEFKEGDRVRIKNKLKKPATWPKTKVWNQGLAQKATITHTYREQVHFRTDNGVKTWRAGNNLELI
jgi:hypothetical protein